MIDVFPRQGATVGKEENGSRYRAPPVDESERKKRLYHRARERVDIASAILVGSLYTHRIVYYYMGHNVELILYEY